MKLLKIIFVVFFASFILLQSKDIVKSEELTSKGGVISPVMQIDSEGFILMNGKRFFPITLFSADKSDLESSLEAGVNTASFVDNYKDHELIESVIKNNLYWLATPYGDSPDSYNCDLRQKSPEQDIRCSVCNGTEKTCPVQCNYCNVKFISKYAKDVVGYKKAIGFGLMDEPGNRLQFLDGRYYKVIQKLKESFPGKLIFSGDFLHCYARKNPLDGKWMIDRGGDDTTCDKFMDLAYINTLASLKDENIDVFFAESGYFVRRKPDSNAWYPPAKDDIQQLIGSLEYFRQESGRKTMTAYIQTTGREAPNQDFFAYSPTTTEIRSLAYVALGHQAKGIHFGLWIDLNSPLGKQQVRRIRKVIQELKENSVIEHYLQSVDVSSQYSSDKSEKIDITAFKSSEFNYLIVANITNEAQAGKVIFPTMISETQVEIVGTDETTIFSAGQSEIIVSLLPHQTKVYRWSVGRQ